MIQKKICLIGAFAVGKTSLVSRFVTGLFSDKYHTTVGVKIDKKQMCVEGRDLALVIWDLAGEDEFIAVRTSYLRGAAGCLLVLDGTRRDTISTVLELKQRVDDDIGAIPCVILANKSDLLEDWEIEDRELQDLLARGWPVQLTSAKTGDGVEEAFTQLARLLLPTS